MNRLNAKLLGCGLAALLLAAPGYAEGEARGRERSLDSMSIEELLNIEISSAARKPQEQHRVPAAVFVITREDIARSTATSIPDLLRMAPGVNVAKLDANKWSVTIRGFSGRFADKLLVLVDGQSIYSPIFSGTVWEDVNYPLELIERIEVIRGPGGAAWGANAVNGIINIITRRPADIDGGLVSVTAGTDINGALSALYGGPAGPNRHARLYLREFHGAGGEPTEPGRQREDRWRARQVGLGMDWELGEDQLMVYLHGMENRLDETYLLSRFRAPYRRFYYDESRDRKLSLLARWERDLGDDSALRLQTFFDAYRSDTLTVGEARHTGDVDFQHQFQLTPRQEIVWGLGMRYTADDLEPDLLARFDPERRRYRTFSGFVQNEIAFLDESLHLTLGTKLEHNDFTGIEVQPTVRLAWTPSEGTTWWAAVTRAVGSPSRAESDIRLRALAFPGLDVSLVGNKRLKSESVVTTEAGLRRKISHDLSVDLTVFYSDYSDFRTTVLMPPFLSFQLFPPRALAEFRATNDASAVSKGVELVLDWHARPRWRTRLMWSYLDIRVNSHTNLPDLITPTIAGDTPTHQVTWQHQIALTRTLDLDIDLRYVGKLESLDIGAYTTADARLGWRPRDNLEFEIGARNLLQPDHAELEPTFIDNVPSNVKRSVYGQITWEF